MGIEEAILKEVREQGLEQGELKTTVKGIQKALKRGKLSLSEIAEDFEVSLSFVQQVQKGEISLEK